MFTAQDIANHLEKSDENVQKALMILWERQTSDEKLFSDTVYRNSHGFNKADAWELSFYAIQVEKGTDLERPQAFIVRRKLQKYCGQLAIVANERLAQRQGQM